MFAASSSKMRLACTRVERRHRTVFLLWDERCFAEPCSQAHLERELLFCALSCRMRRSFNYCYVRRLFACI